MSNKNILVCLSVIEAIYIVYMFNYFKTRYSFEFDRPLLILNILKVKLGISSKYLDHSMESSKTPISHICPVGHWGSWLIGGFLIGRHYIKILKNYNIAILIIIFMLCLANMNAVIYILPIYLIELYKYCYNYKN